MNLAEMYRVVTKLLDTGWSVPEIERLSYFRSRYEQTKDDLPDLNLEMRHLEFIRWLIQKGKLSDW